MDAEEKGSTGLETFTMIELIFVVCLSSGTGACEERVQSYLPDVGIVGCMMTAQQQLAQYSASHPEHRIDRWTCGWSGNRGQKA
jgi:hypothetical protein